MHSFYQCNAKISTSASKDCSVWLLSVIMASKVLQKMMLKLTSVKADIKRPPVMDRSPVRRHFLAPVSEAGLSFRYARIFHLQVPQLRQKNR